MNLLAMESAGEKPEGSRNVRPNIQLVTEKCITVLHSLHSITNE